MANGHGGPRTGSGRKKKSLTEKVATGNPGKRPLTVTEFDNAADLFGVDIPPPREYMSATQKNGGKIHAVEIYESTWNWLKDRDCVHLVSVQLIEQYAMSVSRWIQCEEAINEYGFLTKHPTTGSAISSPYVTIAQSYMKQANNLWLQIYQIVKENNLVDIKEVTPHDDAMEMLLSIRKG